MAEIVVALDQETGEKALDLVDRLEGLRWVKVGPVLFVREGPALIEELKRRDLQVFLDLKWHDIPSTVAGAVKSAEGLGVDMATVHSLGGREMLTAAVSARRRLSLVAVSVLTSHDDDSLGISLGRDVTADAEVGRLAALSVSSGVDGMVCSGQEIGIIRKHLGQSGPVVVPGIRMNGTDLQDQRRVMDPASAARRGATHLVVGRPVTAAADPAGTLGTFIDEAG